MRKFIISDLHGSGEVYDSIMGYLDNLSLIDDIELYINGDLIDRGLDSYYMLRDVIDRCNGKGNIKINYLAGNHELMFYQACLERHPGRGFNPFCNWIENGGWILEGELDVRDEAETYELQDFIKNLKIYHKFKETINDNNLLLVHAQAPQLINDECTMTISHNNRIVRDAVWNRKENRVTTIHKNGKIISNNPIGKDGYYTIIGHTPVLNGFSYDKEEQVINIDGGCAAYAIGEFNYNKVPLVEVEDNKLTFLIFNHNNEIIDGYTFNGEFNKLSDSELDKKRIYLKHAFDNREEFIKNRIVKIYKNT